MSKPKKNNTKPLNELVKKENETRVDENTIMTPGTQRTVAERENQMNKGYTLNYDFNSNPPGTLSQAAKALLEFDVHKRIDAKPNGWDTYLWQKQSIKPERERLAVAAAWCIAELDRYYYSENQSNEKKEG